MVGRDDPMQNALLVGDEEVLEVDGGAGDDGWRLIGRAAVGVDQDGPMTREVFSEAHAYGPYDMPDCVRVVITWNSDENLRRTDILKSCFSWCSEWCETVVHDGVAAGSDVGSQA